MKNYLKKNRIVTKVKKKKKSNKMKIRTYKMKIFKMKKNQL